MLNKRTHFDNIISRSDPVGMSPVPVPAVLRRERSSSLQSLGEERQRNEDRIGRNRIGCQIGERNPLEGRGTTPPHLHHIPHTPHTHTGTGDQGLAQGS